MTDGPVVTAGSDTILLSVPADGAYLGVLRTAAAGLAARLHFTLDEIEDLRIAVDEACAMLLKLATSAAELRCRFTLTGPELAVEVSVPTGPTAMLPTTSSFAWKVLSTLANSPAGAVGDGTATISLAARRTDLPAARVEGPARGRGEQQGRHPDAEPA